jgi:hypothetical protein
MLTVVHGRFMTFAEDSRCSLKMSVQRIIANNPSTGDNFTENVILVV